MLAKVPNLKVQKSSTPASKPLLFRDVPIKPGTWFVSRFHFQVSWLSTDTNILDVRLLFNTRSAIVLSCSYHHGRIVAFFRSLARSW